MHKNALFFIQKLQNRPAAMGLLSQIPLPPAAGALLQTSSLRYLAYGQWRNWRGGGGRGQMPP